MKIAIIGTGGVGGYFGGKLAHAGEDVTFVARGEHLKVLQTHGLTVKSINGDFMVNPVNATNEIRKIGNPDLVLLAVKAWQIRDISRELKSVIHQNTVVIPLQNGVLAAEEMVGELNRENVVGGLCRIMSKIESPGIITHFGVAPTIVFGELDCKKTERMDKIKELFDKAGFNSIISNDIQADIWKKFITICVSGLLAITRSTYGVLREMEGTRRLLRELMTEIYQVALKAGISLNPDIVDRIMDGIDAYPYDSSSSLARDVWEGKPSEIDYQNGTVVRLGEKYQVDTPINRFVYHCILPMEIAVRKKIELPK